MQYIVDYDFDAAAAGVNSEAVQHSSAGHLTDCIIGSDHLHAQA